ncbi:YesL family protein [Planococcus lenghuensis]|uniref:DUF624 domain-containing protein n=1 Tax=Planococcus lenghuensis TaxID=2213202 RepID=A0A1Q2L312_9BACL|nr:DUF624 domain-containing protein [Planococcus lenghuensis]AQQ54821.1 hypothetical protein B0X71_18085 [Planococcus lenghuensis]
MQELKGITGVLYAASEWVMRLSAVNLIWFILSLPLFIVFLTVDISSLGGLVLFGLTVLLLMPLLFFPATVAVFATVRDWVTEMDYTSVVRTYLSHLKSAYLDSMKAGIFFAALWLVWYYSLLSIPAEKTIVTLMLLIIGLALFAYTISFMSVSVHYRMSGKERLKNAFLIAAGSPLLSLFMLLSNGLLVWISLTQLLFLLPLFTCSLGAFLSFSAFYRFTLKVEKRAAAYKNTKEGFPK